MKVLIILNAALNSLVYDRLRLPILTSIAFSQVPSGIVFTKHFTQIKCRKFQLCPPLALAYKYLYILNSEMIIKSESNYVKYFYSGINNCKKNDGIIFICNALLHLLLVHCR